MSAILSPRLAVLFLMFVATVFAANHIAARLAFDHGTSVAAAVAVRSGITAAVMVALLRAQGISLILSRRTFVRGLAIGTLVAAQSYCLYSAVAAIPVALALLVFYTYPMLLVLLIWAVDGEHPGWRAFVAMPLAFVGMALALDLQDPALFVSTAWAEMGEGIAWSLGGGATFALTLYFATRYLKDVDGRMRTLLTMGTTAVLVGAAGAVAGALSLPADGTGWLGLVLLTVLYGAAITAVFTIVPRLGAASSTAALNFEPIAALGLGWAILGQSMAPRQMVGAVVVVGAVLLLGARR